MNERLNEIYRCISSRRGVVDVGTDHGYLPIQLVKDGFEGAVFASDIRSGPLASARRFAERDGVADRITFLQCDGLDDCPPESVDTIVIAGMGGDTICGILDRAEWCWSSAYTLILQPMTRAEVLRYWLVNNGFHITEERLVRDRSILYQIILAVYTGVNTSLLDAELFVGSFDGRGGDALFLSLLEDEIRRLRASLDGRRKSGENGSVPSFALTENVFLQLSKERDRCHEGSPCG